MVSGSRGDIRPWSEGQPRQSPANGITRSGKAEQFADPRGMIANHADRAGAEA